MKKHGAKAHQKLKADLERARLERLARPAKRSKRNDEPQETVGAIVERVVDALKGA